MITRIVCHVCAHGACMRAKQNDENDYNHTTSALSLKVELTSNIAYVYQIIFQKVNMYEERCTYLCLFCRG